MFQLIAIIKLTEWILYVIKPTYSIIMARSATDIAVIMIYVITTPPEYILFVINWLYAFRLSSARIIRVRCDTR